MGFAARSVSGHGAAFPFVVFALLCAEYGANVTTRQTSSDIVRDGPNRNANRNGAAEATSQVIKMGTASFWRHGYEPSGSRPDGVWRVLEPSGS